MDSAQQENNQQAAAGLDPGGFAFKQEPKMPRHSTKQTKNKKNAPGRGRPKLIEDRVRIVTYIEAEDATAVDLLGKRSEVARDAILAYIKS